MISNEKVGQIYFDINEFYKVFEPIKFDQETKPSGATRIILQIALVELRL